MRTIKASDFKTRCLALLDEVARTGEPVVITRNGRPVAELRPCTGDRPASPFGLHKGKIRVVGDIMEPIDMDEWEAQR